ncbi:hypothetical protein D3C75_1213070 [compost metagenome]
MSSIAKSNVAIASSVFSNRFFPASVRLILRVVRVNNGTPVLASRSLSDLLIEGVVTLSLRAAAEMLPSRAMTWKIVS